MQWAEQGVDHARRVPGSYGLSASVPTDISAGQTQRLRMALGPEDSYTVPGLKCVSLILNSFLQMCRHFSLSFPSLGIHWKAVI